MDAFDQLMLEPTEVKQKKIKGDAFDQFPELEEGFFKSAFRTAYQIPSGIGQVLTYPLDLISMVATGSALDPEAIDELKRASEQQGITFDEEAYRDAVSQIAHHFPTQSNIERKIEESTGVPLAAKTKGQKLLKLASTAGGFTPGAISQKLAAAATAPTVAGGLEFAGVPEPLAELGGLAASGFAGAKTPKISAAIESQRKESGLPIRRFETLEAPKEISVGRLQKISDTIESDFKRISDDIISTSPLEETHRTLKENPAFKQEVREKFKDVENLAEQIPERLHNEDFKKILVKNTLKKKGTGFAPGEYDKDFRKFITQFVKETPSAEIGAADLVRQYRKNNKELTGAYDPSRSYNYNRAKKDALLAYNHAIGEMIENNFPGSEFSNLFKETNSQWKNISDSEAITKFIDGIFDGKIKFEKGRRFFENENLALPFKRSLGEENFKKFETLLNDMLQSEVPYKMLRIAKEKGFKELFQTGSAYILHPTLGKAKLAFTASKNAYKSLINAFLDKPRLTVTFKKGLDALKKGDFKAAEREFKLLKGEVEVAPKETVKIPQTIEAKVEKIQPKIANKKLLEGPK